MDLIVKKSGPVTAAEESAGESKENKKSIKKSKSQMQESPNQDKACCILFWQTMPKYQ